MMVVKILALQIDLQLVELTSTRDRAEVAKVNPNAKVPVLIDGDLVLWESRAIMAYLCAQAPGQTLYPTSPKVRADVDRWLFWDAAHLSMNTGLLSFEKLWKVFKGGGLPDPSIVKLAEGSLAHYLPVLEAALANKRWLVGETTTLADLSIACSLMYADKIELSLNAYPNIQAFMARVAELPAWQQTAAALE
jgi:glutathione S-transferase